MFILYALVAGLAIGVAIGGSPLALGAIRFRWAPLVLVGFLAQVVLFSEPVTERIGTAGPPLYVISTMCVGVAILRNARLPGIPLVILGAAANMAAILANDGFMPAAPGALAAIGKTAPVVYSNSSVVAQPALELLTDRFALPRWLPFANVFSVGDVLIGVGVLVLIALTMRRRRPDQAATGAPSDGRAADAPSDRPIALPVAGPGAGMH